MSPPQRPALGRVDQALPAAHEIVGQFARVLEKCVSFDVNDLEVGRVNAADKREREGRRGGAKRTHDPSSRHLKINYAKITPARDGKRAGAAYVV